MVKDQNHRKSCASPAIGRHETDEQATENSNDGSALLGFAFPHLCFKIINLARIEEGSCIGIPR
jgi:hypothetical protein